MIYIFKLIDDVEYRLPDGTLATLGEIIHWKNRFNAMESRDTEACIESLKAIENFTPVQMFHPSDGFYSTGGLAVSFKAGAPVTLTVNNVTYRVGSEMTDRKLAFIKDF